jgi:hypothetical protein
MFGLFTRSSPEVVVFMTVLLTAYFAGGSTCVYAQDAIDNNGKQEPGETEYIYPSGSWLVGSGTSPAGGVNGGEFPACVMANQFKNGYIVRMAGGGGELMAMSVDFRDDLFKEGRTYELSVDFRGKFFLEQEAVLYDQSTLVVDLRHYSGIYDKVKNSEQMILELDDKSYPFSLAGIREGLQRLEECYSSDDFNEEKTMTSSGMPLEIVKAEKEEEQEQEEGRPEPEKPGNAGENPGDGSWLSKSARVQEMELLSLESAKDTRKLSVKTAEPDSEPKPVMVSRKQKQYPDIEKILKVVPVEPLSEKQEQIVEREEIIWSTERLPYTENDRKTAGPIKLSGSGLPTDSPEKNRVVSRSVADGGPLAWSARKGENLQQVLSQWSFISGYEFIWEAGSEVKVPEDFTHEGSFENAVLSLLKKVGLERGIFARITSSEREEYTGTSAEFSSAYLAGNWYAVKGTDLRNVLRLWASEADVELVWNCDVNFPVRKNVSVEGGFEDALAELFSQYEDSGDVKYRPSATLYKDQDTKNISLVIEARERT